MADLSKYIVDSDNKKEKKELEAFEKQQVKLNYDFSFIFNDVDNFNYYINIVHNFLRAPMLGTAEIDKTVFSSKFYNLSNFGIDPLYDSPLIKRRDDREFISVFVKTTIQFWLVYMQCSQYL